MRCFSYLHYPYVPNRQNKKKAGRPTPYPYMHRFAYCETMRGLNDDIPTLLFLAPFELVRDACSHLCKWMDGKVEDLVIRNEHSCRVKNGKCYWRVAVQVIGLDEHFISFREFTEFLVYHMKQICNCTIQRFNLEPFLNL